MKAKTLIATTALLLTMGVGSAHATTATPTPAPSVTEAPVQESDPTLLVVLTPPSLGPDGQIIGPVPQHPSLLDDFVWWVDVVDNMATVTASVLPGSEDWTDLTLTDRSGAVDVIVFDPIALPVAEVPITQCGDVVNGFPVGDNADMCATPPVPDAVESYPAPAPVVTAPAPAPAPLEEDQPGWDCETMGNGVCGPEVAPEVPTSAYAPDAATSERVAAGDELAYTGVNTGLLLMGVMTVGAGIGALYFNSQVRRR